MGFNCGIVGLPNVGKSTLFNALTATAQAEVANFPFTTIEPNVGRVAVPDERLGAVARLAGSAKAVPTHLEFVDIAGLVGGASRGEGLGNQFLEHIRQVDAIAHMLRCFETEGVVHVAGEVDPVRDAATVETELMLADLEGLERRTEAATKRARGGDKEAKEELALLQPALAALRAGTPARRANVAGERLPDLKRMGLLTAKPVLYVCNVDEAAAAGNEHSARVEALAAAEGAAAVVVSAAIEAEIAALDDEAERREFLASLGLAETGLARVLRAGYRLLDLITFFTANEAEAHAWTVARGAGAAAAAGRVHTDMQRGFIRAETISYDDFLAHGGVAGAREAGQMRMEGRDYVVQDGDVMRFHFSA